MKVQGSNQVDNLILNRSRQNDEKVSALIAKKKEEGRSQAASGDSRGLERAAERSGNRQVAQKAEEKQEAKQPADSTDTTVTIPVVDPQGTPIKPDINELARLYVSQYQEGSGTVLSKEAEEAKVKEVADFYSKMQNGEQRLDAIVFANDSNGEQPTAQSMNVQS